MSAQYLPSRYHAFSLHCAPLPDCVIKPDNAGLLFLLHLSCCRRRNQTDISSFSFCFPGILTMSTPWMTGARPSVGCKCRSYNSWSCRYCLCACFGPNIYVSSSPDTSSVSAQPLPVRLISATGSLVEGGPAEWNNFVHLQVISH